MLFRQPDKGGGANGTVYRTDNQGNITSYAVYDSEGMIIKRVDVTGAAHTDVSTLHVIDMVEINCRMGLLGFSHRRQNWRQGRPNRTRFHNEN
ncbi:polymorphic toxin type 24 domain-containing protein [Pseudomonas poae]|uniref:polymorphic toxin type 24 domain-containing protein n=1 Tax=Pseudomonas poae TaxID=200451 RepID=UPI0039B112FF